MQQCYKVSAIVTPILQMSKMRQGYDPCKSSRYFSIPKWCVHRTFNHDMLFPSNKISFLTRRKTILKYYFIFKAHSANVAIIRETQGCTN